MRDGAKVGRRRVSGVEFGDVGLAEVGDRAEPELLRLIDRRLLGVALLA